MATLPILRASGNGDGTTHQPRGVWGNEDYTRIDEDITAPDGAGIVGPFNAPGTTSFTLGDTPSDFGNMDTVSVTARLRLQNHADDLLTLLVKVVAVDGTLLASGASASNRQLVSFGGSSTMTTLAPVAFTTVNTAATKTQWDGAILEIHQGWSAVGGTDSFVSYVVDCIEISGTYTIAAAGGSGAGDISGIGSIEGNGWTTTAGAGDVSGVGVVEADGSILASGSGDIFGIGTSDATGDAGFLPPTIFTTTDVSSTVVSLNWSIVDAADFYEVERQRWDGVDWVEPEIYSYLEGVVYDDDTVVVLEKYRYRIRSVSP